MTVRVGTAESSGPVAVLSGRTGARRLLVPAALAVAYYLGAQLGLKLSLVAVAALAVNLPISATVLAAFVTAVGNTLAPVAAVTLLHRVGFRRQLDRQRDAMAIVFLGALASMLVSATIGSVTLVTSGSIQAAQLPTAWAVWWTGDVMGVLVVTPFLLCLPLFWEQRRWPLRQWLEGAVVLVVAALLVT